MLQHRSHDMPRVRLCDLLCGVRMRCHSGRIRCHDRRLKGVDGARYALDALSARILQKTLPQVAGEVLQGTRRPSLFTSGNLRTRVSEPIYIRHHVTTNTLT